VKDLLTSGLGENVFRRESANTLSLSGTVTAVFFLDVLKKAPC
jgi:hypothetical protein